MHKFFSTSLFLFLVVLTFSASSQAETGLSLESAINKAGRQRMLSQRIVLKYAQLGQDLFAKNAQLEINWDIALFETQLEELKKFSNDEIIQETLEWETIVWKKFQSLASGEVSQENARHLNHLSEDLLYGSNKVAVILQDMKNRPLHRLVNLAGRQRMLSQRLSKYYLLRSWGFNNLSINDELDMMKREFETALETLRIAPETTDYIRELLEMAIIQWTWFSSVLSRDTEQGDYRLIIVDASNNLLEIMEEITLRYTYQATSATH